MNRGLITGLNTDTWRTYTAKQLIAANSGALTQPLGTGLGNPYNFARYYLIDRTYCVVEMNYSLVDIATAGSGGSYVWNLPFPAKRVNGDNYVGGTGTGQVIGRGEAYISFATASASAPSGVDVNTPLVVTLADPFLSLGGDHNSYFQAYSPHILDWGQDSIASGTSTTTTTHKAGFAFDARDIDLTLIDNNIGATVTKPWPRVTSITSTQFTATIAGTTAAATSFYNYKIRAEPPTGQTGALCSPTVPYDYASKCGLLGNFMNWFFYLFYELA